LRKQDWTGLDWAGLKSFNGEQKKKKKKNPSRAFLSCKHTPSLDRYSREPSTSQQETPAPPMATSTPRHVRSRPKRHTSKTPLSESHLLLPFAGHPKPTRNSGDNLLLDGLLLLSLLRRLGLLLCLRRRRLSHSPSISQSVSNPSLPFKCCLSLYISFWFIFARVKRTFSGAELVRRLCGDRFLVTRAREGSASGKSGSFAPLRTAWRVR